MLLRSRIAVFSLGIMMMLSTTSCASTPRPKAATQPTRTSAWLQVLIDDTSDPQIRIRPRAASQDAVFGPLLRRAEREAAAAIGNVLVGQSALQVFEKSEMVTIAARHVRPIDAVVIFAGVPGAMAPESMVDERGHALWKKVDARVQVDRRRQHLGDGARSGGRPHVLGLRDRSARRASPRRGTARRGHRRRRAPRCHQERPLSRSPSSPRTTRTRRPHARRGDEEAGRQGGSDVPERRRGGSR